MYVRICINWLNSYSQTCTVLLIKMKHHQTSTLSMVYRYSVPPRYISYAGIYQFYKRWYHFSFKVGGQPKDDIGLSGAKKDDIILLLLLPLQLLYSWCLILEFYMFIFLGGGTPKVHVCWDGGWKVSRNHPYSVSDDILSEYHHWQSKERLKRREMLTDKQNN